jgi:hypothetical protein
VGAIGGLALGAVGGDRVPMGQALGRELLAGKSHASFVVGAKDEALTLSVDGLHHGPFAGDQCPIGTGSQGHHVVASRVGTTAGGQQLGAREPARLAHALSCSAVELLHVRSSPGKQHRIVALFDVPRPGVDGPVHGLVSRCSRHDALPSPIPGHGLLHIAGPQGGEGLGFAGVDLAQVLGQDLYLITVAVDQSLQGTARANGAELTVVAHQHHLGSGGLRMRKQAHQVGVVGHAHLVEHDHVSFGEGHLSVVKPPSEAGQGPRLIDAGLASEVAGRLSRGGGAQHLVAGGLEASRTTESMVVLPEPATPRTSSAPLSEVQMAVTASSWAEVNW